MQLLIDHESRQRPRFYEVPNFKVTHSAKDVVDEPPSDNSDIHAGIDKLEEVAKSVNLDERSCQDYLRPCRGAEANNLLIELFVEAQ